jgi:hypothetical protein
MISKETFLNTIKRLEELDQKVEQVDAALRNLSPDFSGLYIPDTLDIVLDVLEDVFNDHEHEWLSYFMFERNWLHDFELGDIIIDGNPISIQSWSDVYDFLITEMQ